MSAARGSSAPMRVQWVARLVDPALTKSVGEASGRTPEEALANLRTHLRWLSDREHREASRLEGALEVALRHSTAAVAASQEDSLG